MHFKEGPKCLWLYIQGFTRTLKEYSAFLWRPCVFVVIYSGSCQLLERTKFFSKAAFCVFAYTYSRSCQILERMQRISMVVLCVCDYIFRFLPATWKNTVHFYGGPLCLWLYIPGLIRTLIAHFYGLGACGAWGYRGLFAHCLSYTCVSALMVWKVESL